MKERRPVRMSPNEASITSCLAQWPNMPTEKKLELIFGMTPEYQAIGLMIADIDVKFVKAHTPAQFRKAARMIKQWAANNRKDKK